MPARCGRRRYLRTSTPSRTRPPTTPSRSCCGRATRAATALLRRSRRVAGAERRVSRAFLVGDVAAMACWRTNARKQQCTQVAVGVAAAARNSDAAAAPGGGDPRMRRRGPAEADDAAPRRRSPSGAASDSEECGPGTGGLGAHFLGQPGPAGQRRRRPRHRAAWLGRPRRAERVAQQACAAMGFAAPERPPRRHESG